MTRPRHILRVLAALLMLVGGAYVAIGAVHGSDRAHAATIGCDHCPDQKAASDRLCAVACAMTAAIVPDEQSVAMGAAVIAAAPFSAPAISRDSRPDPYPPRPAT